jgi:creatinine amidohydrolase
MLRYEASLIHKRGGKTVSEKTAYVLSDMSWPEVKQALETVRVALIAVGSTEQHGPNLALQADTAQAHAFAMKLAQRFYPQVLLAPPIHVGISDHHMAFPGSLTLRPETFYAFLHDIIESLKHHGLKKFLLINGHGGNAATLGMSLVRLKRELGVEVAYLDYYTLAPEVTKEHAVGDTSGHACEIEVSQSMYLAPHIVKTDQLAKGDVKGYPYKYLSPAGVGRRVNYPYSFDQITANGCLGDATQATREIGEAVVEKCFERAAEFVEDYLQH